MCSELTRKLRTPSAKQSAKDTFSHLQGHYTSTVDEDDPSTYVTCQVCGAKVGKLTSHHVEQHDMTMATYRECFPYADTVSGTTKGRVRAEQLRRLQDPDYYALMCENLDEGRDKMSNDPELLAARGAKVGASRRGKKNRPDHQCKGWTHVWDSMSPAERSEFIDDRYKWQSSLGATGPRGCTVHYIDRRLQHHTFKSRHELAHAIYLDLLKLDWMYEGWSIQYEDHEGVERKYWPDFVTHYPFLYFEVKPFGMSESVRRKIDSVKKEIPNLVLITHEDILEANTWMYVKDLQEGDTLEFMWLDQTLRKAA